MPARLVLVGVEKTFQTRQGAVQALHDINLTLDDGEFVSVVGASGCGKSTLLRIVAGLETASAGQLTLDNEPLRGPGRDRGMVFQQYTLYPWLSALENVKFGLRHLPKRQRTEVARRFLDVVGLSDFALELSPSALRWDAAARCHRPGTGPAPQHLVDGRAFRCPRCPDAQLDAGVAAVDLGARPVVGPFRHPRHR